MYNIWFNIKGGEREQVVKCSSIEAARIIWDVLNADARIVMTCTRP